MSEAVEAAAKLNAFSIKETSGSDGSKFLDIEIDGDQSKVSGSVQILLEEVFGVSKNSEYDLRYSGIWDDSYNKAMKSHLERTNRVNSSYNAIYLVEAFGAQMWLKGHG